MASIGDIVSDEERKNWRKALWALETTKDGLQHFGEQELKYVHTRILQDVRSNLNLPASADCAICCTANLLKCPTPGVCKKRGKTSCCSMHDSPAKQPRPCPMKFCEGIRDSIAKEHRYGMPSWQNTQAELWASDSWEIAKCFMPPDGYMGVGCSQNTHLDGIINVMLNCKHFENKLSFAIASEQPNAPCLLTKARDIIRSVRRSSQIEVSDIDLQDYFTTLIDLLSDSKFLAHDGSAQEAVRKLRNAKIKLDIMKTIEDKINPLLIAASETCRNNDKESEESLTLTMAYMADCRKKLDELIAEMSMKTDENSKKSAENKRKIDEHSEKIDEISKNTDERSMKIAKRARLIEFAENEQKVANNPKKMDIIHKQISELLMTLKKFTGKMNGMCDKINDRKRKLIQDVHPTLKPQEERTKHWKKIKPVKDTMSLNKHDDAISKHSQQTSPEDGTNTQTSFKQSEQKMEHLLMRLDSTKERFQILRYFCETIRGILTIFEQDFPKASPLLDEKLKRVISTDIVHVYTTKQFRRHFEDRSIEITKRMSTHSVMETIKQTNAFALIVIDSAMQGSVVRALKESDIFNTGVLIVGQSEELPLIPNVFLSQTESDRIIHDADSLLERCAFGILKALYLNVRSYELQNTFSENDEANLEGVFDLIKSALESSDVPAEECPVKDTANPFEYPVDVEKAIETIIGIPGVIMCFKSSEKLQIYVDSSTASSDFEEILRKELDRNDVKGYKISYAKEQQLSQCMSGDSVFQSIGTLGGFVKKIKLPSISVNNETSVPIQDVACSSNEASTESINEPSTAALVSRHVVQQTNLNVLIVDKVLQPIGLIAGVDQMAEIDILPVDVDEDCKDLCDPRFRTELNVSMYSRLRNSGDIRALRGKPVHIWGATSCPGYGIIVEHDATTANGLRIIVRDRRTDEPFAQQGDSGAMICYFDPRHEVLYAVAMLINSVQLDGESTHKRYTGQILDDGLQKLSVMNDCRFSVFEEESESDDDA